MGGALQLPAAAGPWGESRLGGFGQAERGLWAVGWALSMGLSPLHLQ